MPFERKTYQPETGDVWFELKSRKVEFLEILNLLIKFDEKTGRFRRYDSPWTHWLRRSVASADPDQTRIIIRNLGEFVYSVVLQSQSPPGLAICSYVHEDGIRIERDATDSSHPVHSIVCLTDLFENDAAPIVDLGDLHAFTLELMNQARPVVADGQDVNCDISAGSEKKS